MRHHCIPSTGRGDVRRRPGADGASTVGTWLRSLTFGHVRQLDRLSELLLARAWAAGAGPASDDLVIDVDSTICEVHRYAKAGRGVRLHPHIGLPDPGRFNVDTNAGWQTRVDEGRHRWHELQLAAAMRDTIRADTHGAPDRLRRAIDAIVANATESGAAAERQLSLN